MTYVAYHDTRTDAQRVADRKADEQWMRSHEDHDPAPSTEYRPISSEIAAPSAH